MCVSRWVYAEAGWARIAALAPAVVACAQDGDQEAHHILQEGIADLVTAVQAVAKQLNMLQPFQLVLAGGMQHALSCLNQHCRSYLCADITSLKSSRVISSTHLALYTTS